MKATLGLALALVAVGVTAVLIAHDPPPPPLRVRAGSRPTPVAARAVAPSVSVREAPRLPAVPAESGGERAVLLARAGDVAVGPGERVAALERLGRAPIDRSDLARIHALAVSTDLDVATRTAAVTALRQISLERGDLRAAVRAALLDAAERAPTAEVRADALDSVRASGASSDEIARLVAFLGDVDAGVRAGAARALGGADQDMGAAVVPDLDRALATESNVDAARAIIAAALRLGGSEVDALLVQLSGATIVQREASLARQVDDYRALLAQGERNSWRILTLQAAREDAWLRSRNQ